MSDKTELRPCIVCHKPKLADHEAQCCVTCLGRARRDLISIEQLYALLPAEIEGRAGTAKPLDVTGVRSDEISMPGGDALVLLAGGASGVVSSKPTTHKPEGDRSHAADNLPTDVPSVLATLVTWEDDWRSELGMIPAGWKEDSKGTTDDHRYAPPATVSGTTVFLIRGLSHMAQNHPAFDEFARDIRELKGHMERTLRAQDAVDRGAPCPYCGARIIRKFDDPDHCDPIWVPPVMGFGYQPYLGYGRYADKPGHWKWCDHDTHRGERHDQGGRREGWVCSNRDCGKLFDDEQHRMAVWQAHLLSEQAG